MKKVIIRDSVTGEQVSPVTSIQTLDMPIKVVNENYLIPTIGTYHRFDDVVNSLSINLPTIEDTDKILSTIISFTTGDSPRISIEASAKISYFAGYNIEPNTTYELNIMFNGLKWIVAYGVIY